MKKTRFSKDTLLTKSFAVIFLIFSLSPLFAAEDKVALIERTYQATQTMQAEFVQTTYVEILGKTITRPGRFFYAKGGKLRIEYGGEPMTHYIIDGEQLWIWNPKEKQLNAYDLNAVGIPAEALSFLGGLGNLSEIFHVEESTKKGILILKPKTKTSYKLLRCRFDEKNYLSEMTIQNKSGNKTRYQFFNVTPNVSLPAAIFQPPAH